MIQNLNSPLVTQWNTDSQGNKISVMIENETHQVANCQITLNQIPDKVNRVQIDNMYEINSGEIGTNQFRVDYNVGIISFNSSKEAQFIIIKKYYGRGIFKTSAQRIYDESAGQTLDTSKTLQDYINSIKEINFDGNFDPTKIYTHNKSVYFEGSTYVCKQPNYNHETPRNTEFWTAMTSGFNFQGEFNYTKTYVERDIVNFGIEKSLYQCIKPTIAGTSPYNTEYWKIFMDTKDMVEVVNDYANDTTSLYIAHDLGIQIQHNLNDYPLPQAICVTGNGFGDYGYGLGDYGGGTTYQVGCKAEYIDTNNIKLFFDEKFQGTATITKIDNRNYTIDFTEESAQIKLILK